MDYDDQNIFAKILRGEIPCKKLYEDELVLAFADIHPLAPIHALIIPKGAYRSMLDFGLRASAAESQAVFRAVSTLANQLGIAESGFRVISNCGLNGNQEVPHFHLHLLGGKPLGSMLAKT